MKEKLHATQTVRIKEGWDGAGKEGLLFGTHQIRGRVWAVVLWDGDDDPDLYKAASLQVQAFTWKDLK